MALPWTGRSSGLNVGNRAIWVETLGLFIVVGHNDPDFTCAIVTSPDGTVWTDQGNPWGGASGEGKGVAWSEALGLLVAIGRNDAFTAIVATSPDGITWTNQTTPWDGSSNPFANSVTWGDGPAVFVIGGASADEILMTSPDGVTWTEVSTAFDNGRINDIAYSPTLARFVAAGLSGDGLSSVLVSDDAVTWSPGATPFDFFGDGVDGIIWSELLGVYLQLGQVTDGSITIASSVDGSGWNIVTNLFDGIFELDTGAAFFGFDANGRIFMLGGDPAETRSVEESYDGATWTLMTPNQYNAFSAYGGAYSPSLDTVILVGNGFAATHGNAIVSASPVPPAPPEINTRFYESPPWRFVLCDLDGHTITFLDPIAMNRQLLFTLDAPMTGGFDVPSDEPEVNIVDPSGDFPNLSYNNKIIVCLRRENPQPGVQPPWVVRGVGLVMQPNDEITPNTDSPITHVAFYDAWQYWYSRPVLDSAGLLPGKGGLTYPNADFTGELNPARIIRDLLTNSIIGGPAGGPDAAENLFVDFGQPGAPGGGAFYEGNIDSVVITPLSGPINFRQGMMLGEAITQIVEMGACDVILKPIWDPENRPGLMDEVWVYELAGSKKNNVVFSWDKPGRSLNGMNRLSDGQQMGNVEQFYAGQGGDPVARQDDDDSITSYGPYWQQEFYSGNEAFPVSYVALVALARARANALGKETFTCDVAPEFGPIPFQEYYLGDQTRVYATSRFRAPIFPIVDPDTDDEWVNMYRVYAIPVSIPDDAPETVAQLLMTSPTPIVTGGD